MQRSLSLRDHRRSKVRGARRKCRAMIEAIEAGTTTFPAEQEPECGYWHVHLPVDQAFIDSQKTPHWVRRQCVQCLIDGAERLRYLKPKSRESIRVVTCISSPELWDSQIIVFFDHEYFSSFFDRDSDFHSWTPLSASRLLSREWSLNVPDIFSERGYHERIRDEDYSHDGEVWFFGDLD